MLWASLSWRPFGSSLRQSLPDRLHAVLKRRADAAIKRGVKAEDYYQQEVVGKGVAEIAQP